MSSSDNIKIALAAAYPGTNDKVWKRRSKTKVAGGTERVFENTTNGQTVTTLEAADGTVQVDGVTYKAGLSKAPVAAPTAPSAAPATASAPKAPKAAPAAPVAVSGTKIERNQMVPGSIWVFDRDVVLDLWVSNPARDALIQQRHPRGGWMNDPQIAAMDEKVIDRVATIPAGTKITVIGKSVSESGYSSTPAKFSNGLMFPVRLEDNHGVVFASPVNNWRSGNPLHFWSSKLDTECQLPFKMIADAITPLEIPYTPVFVLRDAATGELFGGWKTEAYTMERGHEYGYEPYRGTRSDVGNPKMVTKLSSAKKYATSSAAKASIREFTGYNEGLEEGDEGGAYYIMGGKKAMDLPPTWEMVEFDKVTGAEKRVIEIQNWLKSLNRLRVLTTTHGSAARAAYKKAEAHAEDFPVILIFQNRSVGSGTDWKGGRYSWDEKARFDDWRHGPAAIKAIDDAIKAISGKTLKAKSASAVSVACQSLSDAIYAKMSFDFDSRDDQAIGITLLDFNTLEEIVDAQ